MHEQRMPDRIGFNQGLVHVMVGVIADDAGRILVTRRPDHVHQGGLWEFPGGKLEPGESLEQGLSRELAEELGIQVRSSRPLIRVHHHYADPSTPLIVLSEAEVGAGRHVLLDVRRVEVYSGTPEGREGQPLDWLEPEAMDPDVFPAADRPIINALRLPSLFMITGGDPRRTDEFLERVGHALDQGIRLVQLRAHDLDDQAYRRLASAVYAVCDTRRARLLLNREPRQVSDVPRHGLHLSARTLMNLTARPGRSHELIGASCHDTAQLEQAARLGLDYALLSPVKPTATHPDALPLGWQGFADLVEPIPLPVYALGGLGPTSLQDAIEHGAQGIAAIRGLWPDA
ncbi:Nudix family hydrolase [Thiocystis violascens]|uniref:8-oxo-dGTP diphosphatase n=1 Tax=Thiocystis violascens (strain ATCC 17096 / DSM 198 / 6111) TaxID=765911 RepID=I3YB86_THIV6|nr:thiamine monophosphate synthase [Thiocystis violascens DSM 198]